MPQGGTSEKRAFELLFSPGLPRVVPEKSNKFRLRKIFLVEMDPPAGGWGYLAEEQAEGES